MKTLIAAVVTALLLGSLTGLKAEESQWLTDFAKAKAQAEKDNKLVLMDFTGSDWCPPCKALHKNVFSTEEFAKFAKENLVLVEVDFPRRKAQSEELKQANKELARKYDIDGYPTVVILDKAGKTLSKEVGYQGDTAATFIGKVKKLLPKK